MKNITIMGGGVLGSQIAFQSAYCGFNVTIWLRSESSIERTKPKLENLRKSYIEAIELMDKPEGKNLNNWCRGIALKDEFNKEECLKKVEEAFQNIKLELEMKKAVEEADLVIESMSEEFNAKKELYQNYKINNVIELTNEPYKLLNDEDYAKTINLYKKIMNL